MLVETTGRNCMKHLFILCLLMGRLLMAQTPDSPAFTEAEALAKANNCEEAINKYDQAIQENASNPKYYVSKASCQNKLKMQSEALSTLDQALRIKADYQPALQMKAKIYEGEKNYGMAVQAYTAQLPLEKVPAKKSKIYASIVRLYLMQNEISSAEKYLSEARAASPNDLEVLYCEGEVMRAKRDYMQAIGFYEKAVLNLGKTGPADAAKFYFGLGDSYMKVGDRDNAIKAWQKARYGPYKKPVEAELMKTNPDFYLKLGISYFQAGEYDEANKHLLKAIQIQTDYAQAYRYLGLISDKRDLTSEAESYYQKAMQYELNPDKRLEIEISFLNMLMDNELFQKALTLAESILKEKPGNVKIMLQKAQAEYNIGRFSLAAKTIQKAITDPSLSDPAKKSPYQFVLGMALKSMGDSDGALEAFRLVTSGSCKNAAQYEMELLQPEVY